MGSLMLPWYEFSSRVFGPIPTLEHISNFEQAMSRPRINIFTFAPSISRFLNFKLPVESSPQSQPLQDFLL